MATTPPVLVTEGLQAHRAKVLRQDKTKSHQQPSPTRPIAAGGAGAWDVFEASIRTGLMGLSPTELRNADYSPIVFPR